MQTAPDSRGDAFVPSTFVKGSRLSRERRSLCGWKPPVCQASGEPRQKFTRRGMLRTGALAAAAAAAAALRQAGPAWGVPQSASSLSARTVVEDALRRSVLYESASGSLLPVSALPNILARRDERCFVVGEVHDELESHAAQLVALETLHKAADRPMVVGFEMFYRQHNPALHAFIRREIGLDALLQRTDWAHSWGYPASLYTPILQYCRQNRIRIIGLNCPEQLTRFVAKVGLKDVSETYPQLRRMLPADIDVSNADHRRHFYRAMGFGSNPSTAGPGAHSAMISSQERLDRWYEAQCTWDEVMAESLAVALDSHPEACVMAFVGAGHVDTRTAIPDRIQKRSGERPFSIVTRPVGWRKVGGVAFPDIEAPERGSDLIWYTSRKLDLV